VKHLDTEDEQVGYSLTFRVVGRPQLQVFDSVIGASAVSMMDHLVGPEWSPEMNRHDQPVLSDFGDAADEST
jgi:hypothetical protein